MRHSPNFPKARVHRVCAMDLLSPQYGEGHCGYSSSSGDQTLTSGVCSALGGPTSQAAPAVEGTPVDGDTKVPLTASRHSSPSGRGGTMVPLLTPRERREAAIEEGELNSPPTKTLRGIDGGIMLPAAKAGERASSALSLRSSRSQEIGASGGVTPRGTAAGFTPGVAANYRKRGGPESRSPAPSRGSRQIGRAHV